MTQDFMLDSDDTLISPQQMVATGRSGMFEAGGVCRGDSGGLHSVRAGPWDEGRPPESHVPITGQGRRIPRHTIRVATCRTIQVTPTTVM